MIPIKYGYPSEEMMENHRKGEILLKGCIIFGNEPKWFCKRDKTEF